MSTNSMTPAQSPVVAVPEKKPPASIWILASWKDLLLFVGTPLLLLPLIPATMKWSLFSVEDFSLFALAFASTGHHLPGMLRAYGDKQLFMRYKMRFIVAPVFLVTICMVSFSLELQGLALLFLIWGVWHAIMQVYGFARIYDAKVKSFDRLTARLDWLMCVAWFGAGFVFSPERMSGFLEEFYLAGGPTFATTLAGTIQTVWTCVLTVVTFAFVANIVWRILHGGQISFAKLLLFAISFGFWWLVMISIDNVIMGVAIWEIFHDIQYLAIVWVYNRRRVDKDNRVGSFTQFLFRRSWLMIGLYVGLVSAYGYLGFATKTRMFIDHETVNRLLLGVIAASGFLHFYFDGFIWKVRERSTREGLGLKGGQTDSGPTNLVPSWVRHGILWSLFVVPLGLLWSWNNTPETEVYQHLTASLPNYEHYHLKLGVAWQKQGESAKAEASLRQAIELDPTLDQAYETLGAALLSQNREKEAIEQLKIALQLDPDLTECHYRMGMAFGQLDDHDNAIASYERAIELDPSHMLAHFGMGKAYTRSCNWHLQQGDHTAAQRDLTRAAKSFRRVIQINPKLADAHTALNQVSRFQRSLIENPPSP